MAVKEASALYDKDFFEWTERNAQLIRSGQIAEADLEHIAEEIEDMGKRDQHEVRSRLRVLIAHLLKWQFQPDRRYSESGNSSWRPTIVEQRTELEDTFEQSPSLKRHGCATLAGTYRRAVRSAAEETNLPIETFPIECPYSFEQIMDVNFLPE